MINKENIMLYTALLADLIARLGLTINPVTELHVFLALVRGQRQEMVEIILVFYSPYIITRAV